MQRLSNQITLKQKLFCEYFVSEECRHNATKAYAKAYGLDLSNKSNYSTAKSNGHRLLTNTYIQNEISLFMCQNGLPKVSVDLCLLSLMKQSDNLLVSLRAVELYYKITGKIKQHTQRRDKVEIKSLGLADLLQAARERDEKENDSKDFELEEVAK